MKAANATRYGPPEVVRIVEVPRPRPGANDIQVRVHASAVISWDARLRALRVPQRMRLMDLVEKGAHHPVIGQKMAFAKIVEAHRVVDTGHKRGSLVIEFS